VSGFPVPGFQREGLRTQGRDGSILVIRGGAIGDFILTLPALAALRTQFPQARLALLGYPHIASLALAGGLADEMHPIEARELAAFFNAQGEARPKLAEFFASFAVIISYLYDPDGVFERNVRRCSAAIFVAGPHRPHEAESVHASEVFLKALEQLAIFDADPCPRLRFPAAQTASSGGPTPTLAAHPGSGSERKNWPESCWATLLEHLASRPELRLLLVGGEAEGGRLDRLAARWPAGRLEVARGWPLVEVAHRLAASRAFIGHDSGITHLAAALGLDGVVLWGGTSEAVWRPRSERMTLLRGARGLPSIEVTAVESALEELLARPCCRDGGAE
jgi:ADP-heptose:LPS heptosyltransferase